MRIRDGWWRDLPATAVALVTALWAGYGLLVVPGSLQWMRSGAFHTFWLTPWNSLFFCVLGLGAFFCRGGEPLRRFLLLAAGLVLVGAGDAFTFLAGVELIILLLAWGNRRLLPFFRGQAGVAAIAWGFWQSALHARSPLMADLAESTLTGRSLTEAGVVISLGFLLLLWEACREREAMGRWVLLCGSVYGLATLFLQLLSLEERSVPALLIVAGAAFTLCGARLLFRTAADGKNAEGDVCADAAADCADLAAVECGAAVEVESTCPAGSFTRGTSLVEAGWMVLALGMGLYLLVQGKAGLSLIGFTAMTVLLLQLALVQGFSRVSGGFGGWILGKGPGTLGFVALWLLLQAAITLQWRDPGSRVLLLPAVLAAAGGWISLWLPFIASWKSGKAGSDSVSMQGSKNALAAFLSVVAGIFPLLAVLPVQQVLQNGELKLPMGDMAGLIWGGSGHYAVYSPVLTACTLVVLLAFAMLAEKGGERHE